MNRFTQEGDARRYPIFLVIITQSREVAVVDEIHPQFIARKVKR